MNKNLVIYGAGGHGMVLEDIALLSSFEEVQFIDDKSNDISPISIETFQNPVVIGIGDNNTRKNISEKHKHLKYINLIHPSSIVSKSAIILEGSVIMALSHVGVAAKIGKHVIVNSCASIDHHCIINDFVHIAPNATLCGSVTVEEGVLIGAGAIVLPGLKIGAWSKIAAGAVVINDIPPGQTYIGKPGKNK